jgi:hypothetical protein
LLADHAIAGRGAMHRKSLRRYDLAITFVILS